MNSERPIIPHDLVLLPAGLYNALIKLRPEWDSETLKVVMTGSAEDGPEWQRHIGNKEKRRKLANRLTHPSPHDGFALRAA